MVGSALGIVARLALAPGLPCFWFRFIKHYLRLPAPRGKPAPTQHVVYRRTVHATRQLEQIAYYRPFLHVTSSCACHYSELPYHSPPDFHKLIITRRGRSVPSTQRAEELGSLNHGTNNTVQTAWNQRA